MLHGQELEHVDMLLAGHNGDEENDAACRHFETDFGHSGAVSKFKHLCGEYPTASAFALGLGTSLLSASIADAPRTILIYNRFQQAHQSLLLLSAC